MNGASSPQITFLSAAARERSFALHAHASPADESAAGVPWHIRLSRKMSNSPRRSQQGCTRGGGGGWCTETKCLHWKRAQQA